MQDLLDDKSEDCWLLERSVAIATMVAHFVCVLYTAYVVYTAHPGSSLFSWHPTLMTIACMFLIAQGVLVFSPQSSLLSSKPRKTKATVHWVLMVLAAICALIGFAAIYLNKENNGKPHFVSWHGLFGLVTVIYIVIQCLAGTNLLYPQLATKFLKLSRLKCLHALSGVMLYMLIAAALLTGMFSIWFTGLVTGTSWYACAACPLLILTIVATQVKNSYIG